MVEFYSNLSIFLVVILVSITWANLDKLNLPPAHIPFYLNSFPELLEKCLAENCTYQDELKQKKCWGYEPDCEKTRRYSSPSCPEDYHWVSSKKEQLDLFYKQADFGYIREQLSEFTIICEPLFKEDSSLECSENLRFCRGRNIMINFTSLASRTSMIRYDMDVLSQGDVGGHCRLDKDKLEKQCDHKSPLQSWAPELRFFEELDKPAQKYCQVTVEKPIFLMKIDATVNMYHHFCDFFNLYLSQHVNTSHPDSFSTDIHVLVWESYPYYSNFAPTWEAFTRHPVWNLNTVKGKVVCFKNVVFPLLPRMIFGLYYNTPVVTGCGKSGMFRAFSEHILFRLKVPFAKRKTNRINIAFLSRNTSYRNVLNEDELIIKLIANDQYEVKKVIFNRHINFKKQLEIIRNSDVLIGMHGAGLTHLLFLPDWAVVFELYNCEDENCYRDLARLRGVRYITWQNKELLEQEDEGHHPDGGAHAKFTNYKFDANEFSRLMDIASSHVLLHRPKSLTTSERDEL